MSSRFFGDWLLVPRKARNGGGKLAQPNEQGIANLAKQRHDSMKNREGGDE